MKRYLVTGGAGFIGSSITHKLLEEGNFVRVFDNQFRGSQNKFSKNSHFEFVQGDIRLIKNVERACKGIDTIVHLAYINGTKYFYEKPDLVLDVGVKGMVNILDAARHHKVKEFFLASSSEVYQNPPIIPTPEDVPLIVPDPYNPRFSYGGGKILSELMAIHIGKTIFKKAVIFRPHNVYGPDMGNEHVIPELIKKIVHTDEKIIRIQGSGDETRAFIYIDDFVSGLSLILKRGKNMETYNVGTDEEISIRDLANFLLEASGKNLNVVKGKKREGSPKRRCPDITKLKKLGFKPSVSLNEGLQKTFIWYNNQYLHHAKTS